jgi:hypothetical protein
MRMPQGDGPVIAFVANVAGRWHTAHNGAEAEEGVALVLSSAIRLLLVAGGTVIYLALAILAYGGITAFFSQPALATLAVVVVLLPSPDISPAEISASASARTAAIAGS